MKFCIWKTTGQEYTRDYNIGLMHGKGLYEWSKGEYYRGDFVIYINPFVNYMKRKIINSSISTRFYIKSFSYFFCRNNIKILK